MQNKLEMARIANEQGRHDEALRFFKEVIKETSDLSTKISIAGAIFSTIVLRGCNGRYPSPGTREYDECRKYLRIQMDAYDQADPTIRAEFEVFEDVDNLKDVLSQMERGNPVREEYRDRDQRTSKVTNRCDKDSTLLGHG